MRTILQTGIIHDADLCSTTYSVIVLVFITPVTAAPIIINHTSTDINKIPDSWLQKAKTLTLHYAHTSHGSQLLSGADAWMAYNTKYKVAVREATTEGLPSVTGALRIYDGTLIDTYASPDLYWSGTSGIASTNSIVNSGHYNASMFAFCGELSEMTFLRCQCLSQSAQHLRNATPGHTVHLYDRSCGCNRYLREPGSTKCPDPGVCPGK